MARTQHDGGNPFRLGFIHPGDPFCNRVKEVESLTTHALNMAHVVIFSPRRYGKTSLVKQVIERVSERDFETVYVDYFSIASRDDIAQKLVAAIVASIGRGVINAGVMTTLRGIFSRIMPLIEVTPGGVSISAKYDRVPFHYLLEDIFGGLERYLEAEGRRCLMVLDEFQEISNVEDSKSVEALFREHVQATRRIGFFFVGSRRRILQAMFNEKTRPFYKLAINCQIGIIPRNELTAYICELFRKTGKVCPETSAAEVYDHVEGNTSYVQKLAHFVWDLTEEAVTGELLSRAEETLMEDESPNFQGVFSGLTAGEKRTVVALAKEPTRRPYTIDYLATHGLSHGGLQKNLKSLLARDVIEMDPDSGTYRLTDHLLAKWCVLQKPLYQMDVQL